MKKTLVPIEQALVPFYEWVILAVRLSDGRIAASLSALCNLLKILPHGQAQRIRRDVVLADQLLQVVVQTPGGPQVIDVLTAWAIPAWLNGLNPEMVAPEKRPMIVTLKREAADVLYRHFFRIETEPAAAAGQKPPPAQAQRAPAEEELDEDEEAPWHLLYRTCMAFEGKARKAEAETQAIKAELQATRAEVQAQWQELEAQKQRVAALEALLRGAASARPGAPPKAGSILSPEHLVHVYVLARDVRDQTGEQIPPMLLALMQTFGVPDTSDLPDDAWEQIRSWLWQRRQG